MRPRLLVLGALLLAGCWDFAALRRDYGKDTGDLSPAVDLGGSVDLAVVTDLSVAPDLAMESDLAMPMPDLFSASDFTSPVDLVPQDLRLIVDLLGGCNQPLPAASNTYFVDPAGDAGNTECTNVAPCNTLGKALVKTDGSTSTLIVMAEGTYNHAPQDIKGATTLYGGFFAGFACREPQNRITLIKGTTAGEPTVKGVEAFGAEPTFDGVTILAPDALNGSTPVVAVRLAGSKTATLIRSRVVTGPDIGPLPAASVVYGIEVAGGGSITLDGTEVRIPPIAAPIKSALRLCGANALLKDSRLIANYQNTESGATVDAADGGGCSGPSTNSFTAFRSVIVANGSGNNVTGVALNWTQNQAQFRGVHLERTAIRAENGSVSSTGLRMTEPASIDVLGSTISAGEGVDKSSIAILLGASDANAAHPILVIKDSILYGASVPIKLMTAKLSSVSGFERNWWHYKNLNNDVILNGDEVVTKDVMQAAIAFDMVAPAWGDARFGDPKFQADGFHLGLLSPAKGLARTCYGTESGMKQFDIDGDPNHAFCDIGADETKN